MWFSPPLVDLDIIPFSKSIVFLDDAVYGQSAGQLAETVQATSSSTTTTTTTLPTPPLTIYLTGNSRDWNISAPSGQGLSSIVIFNVANSWSPPQPTGQTTLYVNGSVPDLCIQVSSGACISDVVGGFTSDPFGSIEGDLYVAFLTPGTYQVTAMYSGDNEYPSMVSNSITVTAS
jgi:hypothetical protein